MKKNIVLLHGWGASTKKLEPLGRELRKLSWNVLTLRLPGFDAPPPRSVWGIEDYSDYVAKKAEEKFGRDFFVFGHSFGGRIAINLGRQGLSAGVILCAASGLSRASFLKRAFFWVLAKIGKVFLLLPPLGRGWRELLYKLAREHDYEKAQGVMRKILGKVVKEDSRPLVKKIKVPTLVLWGRQDQMTPVRDTLFIRKNLPQAVIITFRNQGHSLPYNEPEEIAKEIDRWVDSLR